MGLTAMDIEQMLVNNALTKTSLVILSIKRISIFNSKQIHFEIYHMTKFKNSRIPAGMYWPQIFPQSSLYFFIKNNAY